MLELKVVTDERKVVLRFEHSLLSLSKWESKYKKPFMSAVQKTPDELFDYFQMMLLPPEEDTELVYLLGPTQMEDLVNYMNGSFTASSVPDDGKRSPTGEQMTSELIYYWMTALKIDWQAQEWHLSRLMMLIQIAGYKQQPPKKQKETDIMSKWREINEARKKKYGTSG